MTSTVVATLLVRGSPRSGEAFVLARSHLYVPADAPDKLVKALARGADAVIVDLEDAVPPMVKDSARQVVSAWIADQAAAGTAGTEVWVRINPGAVGHDDVRAVVGPALTGVVAAKTGSLTELAALDAVLTECEVSTGLSQGVVRVAPLLESGAAVLRAQEIAGGPRVARLQVGEADLAADLGITVSPDERELDHIRSLVVLVSAAARINAPVAPVTTNFRDLNAFRESTRALARRGFVGRACIHPAQVAIANDVFTPSTEEVDAAHEVVARFEEAMTAGRGVVVSGEGRMVDEAVVRQARRVLERVRP